MKHWILPANPKTYRHIEAFERWGYIDWVQMNNFEVGDIVYIYNARPSCKIICKTIVEQIDITADDKTIDTEFWTDHDAEKNDKYVWQIEFLLFSHFRSFTHNFPSFDLCENSE